MNIQKFNHYNNNTYIHMEIVKKQQTLKNIASTKILVTNISIPLTKFFSALINHEKKFNTSKQRGLKIRYGVVLTFLLPHELSKSTISELSNNIISTYDNLPFVSWISKQGKGKYLNLYICERHFFPEGVVYETIAKNNRYRNKLTGQICSCNSTDKENLQLIYSAGEIISSETVYFSTKKDFFKFVSDKHFNRIMSIAKNKWINLLQKHAKCKVEKAITFHKLVRRNFQPKYMNNVILINKTIDFLEKNFNDALYAMIYCDCYSKKTELKMLELYNKYNDFIKSEGCVYGRYNLSISPRMRNFCKLQSCMELFKEKFSNDLRNLFITIVPQDYF